mmetsp:Transcript_11288/g.22562  ORF Transcript_11288/g.22562 Transcript_11288/m.22562 type:complete len:91 (-) Transcript_11288:661-933(-)
MSFQVEVDPPPRKNRSCIHECGHHWYDVFVPTRCMRKHETFQWRGIKAKKWHEVDDVCSVGQNVRAPQKEALYKMCSNRMRNKDEIWCFF